jgi:quinol monooxygenase YgiN
MIFIAAKFQVLPDHADAWPEIVADFTAATRGEPGCLWFDWSRSVEDPNQYVLIEAFRDDAAGAAHVQSDHFKQAQQTPRPTWPRRPASSTSRSPRTTGPPSASSRSKPAEQGFVLVSDGRICTSDPAPDLAHCERLPSRAFTGHHPPAPRQALSITLVSRRLRMAVGARFMVSQQAVGSRSVRASSRACARRGASSGSQPGPEARGGADGDFIAVCRRRGRQKPTHVRSGSGRGHPVAP